MKKLSWCGGEYAEAKIMDLVCSAEELKNILTNMVPEWAGSFITDKEANINGISGVPTSGYDIIIPGSKRGAGAKGVIGADIGFIRGEDGKWTIYTNSRDTKLSPNSTVRKINDSNAIKSQAAFMKAKKIMSDNAIETQISSQGGTKVIKGKFTAQQILELQRRLKKA